MKRKIIFGIAILIFIVALAGALYYVRVRGTPTPNTLRASGTIEAENIVIAAEVPGRIVALNADEGAQVKAGDVLVQLDTALLDGQRGQAQAALELAQANLAQVQVPTRPEQIRAAEGALAQASAARDGAKQAWLDAQTLRDNPQELNTKIDAARAELAVAEANVKQAEGVANSARLGQNEAQRVFDAVDGGVDVQVQTPLGEKIVTVNPPARAMNQLRTQKGLAGAQMQITFAGVDAAKAARDAAQTNLAALFALRANPLDANARVDVAFAQYQAAKSAVTIAQSKLDALKVGATKEQITAAESQVAQAQAALDAFDVQKTKMTLVASQAGYVVARFAQQGELAVPNAPLLQLANLDALTPTAYLPTSDLGRVQVGDTARVTVDGFADRVFDGRVVFISPDAEFTPRNAQTQVERANLVYAIKISLANPDHTLKPGMAGDVEFSAIVQSSDSRRGVLVGNVYSSSSCLRSLL